MASDISGIRAHILRKYTKGTLTLAQIEEIADKAMAATLAGEPTVDITQSGFDGASSTGTLVVSTREVMDIVSEILQAIDPVDAPQTRQLFVPVDFSLATPLRAPLV